MNLWIAVAGMLATFALGLFIGLRIGFVKGWNALWRRVRSREIEEIAERKMDVKEAYLRGQADALQGAAADKVKFRFR